MTTDDLNPITKANDIAFELVEEISFIRALFAQNGTNIKLGQAESAGAARIFDRWVGLACDLTCCIPNTDEATASREVEQ